MRDATIHGSGRNLFGAEHLMKSEGLVTYKSFGQVLSRFDEAHPDPSARMAAPRPR